jgi:glycosyltransferase involved in cell wall biosynthesis
LFSASVPGPQDTFAKGPDDPANLEICGLRIAGEFAKNTLFRRRAQEMSHGYLAQEHVFQFQPDVVISSNTPLEAQNLVQQAAHACSARFMYWVQDLHGLAIWKILRKRLGVMGELIGRYYMRLERGLFQRSDELILITEDFKSVMENAGIPPERLHVIPNWAPIDEIPVREKENEWSRAHGLADKRCFIYTGTLALKHNPDLLLRLAQQFEPQEDVRVVVVSSGQKADEVKRDAESRALKNVIVLPFQPASVLPSVLAAADVLMAILDPDAGEFCVPSKILSYFCAGRAVLLSVPLDNLAARVVADEGAGVACSPYDTDGFIAAAQGLMDDARLRHTCGLRGLAYAQQHFDIEDITDEFENIIGAAERRMMPRAAARIGAEAVA